MLHRRLFVLPIALALLAPACGPKQPPPQPPKTVEPEKAPVEPIPAGYLALTPHLTVQGVDAAVDYYVKVFAAEKLFAIPGAEGKTMHAQIRIGDSILMIEEENVEQGLKSPLTLGGTPATLMMYVEDVDAAFATAIGAGAKESLPVTEMFWGDKYGVLMDPSGHRWALATRVEDLTPEQMKERAAIANQPTKKTKKKPKKPVPPAWKAIAGTPAADPTPAPYHSVTLALTTSDAKGAIAFYKAAFGAQDKDVPMEMPDGKIAHAELTIGDSILMLTDEFPDQGGTSAATLGGSPVAVHMYTADVDAAFATATGAGGTQVQPVTAKFWGDKIGLLTDPAGFTWSLASRVEELTPEQIQERAKTEGGAAAPADPAAAPADPAAAPADAAATPPAA